MVIGGLHADSKIKVLRNSPLTCESIRIADYAPTDYLENTFDRRYSRQPELLISRRETALWSLETTTSSLSAASGTLVAGLYTSHPLRSVLRTPYVRVVLNERDISSRRRFSAELVFDDDNQLDDLGVTSLFPRRRPFVDRIKRFYFVQEVGDFLKKVRSKTEIPIVVGIQTCWVGEDVRKGTNLDFHEFVPIIPIDPVDAYPDELTLKHVVVRRDYSISLEKVSKLEAIEGPHDLNFPNPRDSEGKYPGPFRGAFTANDVVIFHPFPGYDPYRLVEEMHEIDE